MLREYHTTFLCLIHSYKRAESLAATYIMTPSSHVSVFSTRWQSVAEGKKGERKISINLCYVLHITLEA